MPGKKDFVSVTADGEKSHVQKRLILCNLKEAFVAFKEEHPDKNIHFSKFAELRPKECVLAGASGTHSVCVCTIHQNTKLMISGMKLSQISDGQFQDYRDCLAALRCDPPTEDCYLNVCDQCPDHDKLRERIVKFMDDHMVDEIQYRQWTTTDRSTLEIKVQQSDDFLDTFMSMMKKLQTHDFIAKQQSKFLQTCKDNLESGP